MTLSALLKRVKGRFEKTMRNEYRMITRSHRFLKPVRFEERRIVKKNNDIQLIYGMDVCGA
jgi:hypothetical protein